MKAAPVFVGSGTRARNLSLPLTRTLVKNSFADIGELATGHNFTQVGNTQEGPGVRHGSAGHKLPLPHHVFGR